jgi:FAD/FMN-containing dehydrogenase
MSATGYTKIVRSAADSRYPSFLQGFNRRWFAPRVEAVYLCSTAEGTARALDDALSSSGGGVKVKCGGHCYEDFVYSGETRAVLDVTPMAAAGYDPQRGFYLDAGGTNWGAFQALFRDFGKVLPGGSCYSVGLGGHITGGGYGLLSRLLGLTVDWLTGVEIVVKDDAAAPARVVYVSAESSGDEGDLYWALRGGGGGNFGVITRYYFATLPAAPQEASLVTLGFPWTGLTAEKLGDLLALYAEVAAAPDNLGLFGLFKLMHEAAGEIQLVVQVVGASRDAVRAAHADHVMPLSRRLAEVLPHQPVTRPLAGHPGWMLALPAADLQQLTFYEAVQTLNGSGPNQRGKYKSAYMRKGFPPDQVEAIFNHLQVIPPGLQAADMTQSLLQVDTYGGAINTLSATATAIPQRSSILKLQYQTYWQKAEDDAAFLGWIRDFYAAVYAQTGGVPDPDRDHSGTVDGCYYNYPDVDLNAYGGRDGALHLYFLDNFRRNPRNLVAVKKRWDPADVFHSAQSIPTMM